MIETAARESESPDLWQSIPLDFAFCVLAVIVAAVLKCAGLMS